MGRRTLVSGASRAFERGCMTVFDGRGTRENVTYGASVVIVVLRRYGIRSSSTSDPKGPNESRLAIIIRAMAALTTPDAVRSAKEIASRSMGCVRSSGLGFGGRFARLALGGVEVESADDVFDV